MATRVRSHAKINLGLAIGPPRPDGFHSLLTLYQSLAVHDFVTVSARAASITTIKLSSNNPRVPLDGRNTAWKMAERALDAFAMTAAVEIHIEKHLPIQGGLGAGSANAAAALLGLERELERELDLRLDQAARMRIAAEVGSDVPLFLLGGTVLGTDRGQVVEAVPELNLGDRESVPCVIALPHLGVSTPAAFREWDRRVEAAKLTNLQTEPISDTMRKLSRSYASLFPQAQGLQGEENAKSGASGIFPEPVSVLAYEPAMTQVSNVQKYPENLQGTPDEQLHRRLSSKGRSGIEDDLAGNSLLALVRTGIENDFESVVFLQYPSLREIKQHLMGVSGNPGSAVYAALSGSGSALFGLYRSDKDAEAAQQRLQQHGVEAIVTWTIARPLYWSEMFAE